MTDKQCRDEFEKWAESKCFNITRDEDGSYASSYTSGAWYVCQFNPARTAPDEGLSNVSAISAMIGYCQSLREGTVITAEYMQRINEHYVPQLEAIIAQSLSMDAKKRTNLTYVCKRCGKKTDWPCKCATHNAGAVDVNVSKDLIAEIDLSLDYFEAEFPKITERNKQIWADPLNHHCGGISSDDLVSIKAALSAAPSPDTFIDIQNGLGQTGASTPESPAPDKGPVWAA